jgi:hypothetical protein
LLLGRTDRPRSRINSPIRFNPPFPLRPQPPLLLNHFFPPFESTRLEFVVRKRDRTIQEYKHA